MIRWTRKDTCPYCQSEEMVRVVRSFWMRWIPNSRLLECCFCRREFLQIRSK